MESGLANPTSGGLAYGLPVAILNRDKRLVGVVSLGDLAVESGDKALPGGVLKKVKEPG